LALPPAQVVSLAPNEAAVRRAGQSRPLHLWRDLGRTERAAWGFCSGSGEYTVRVDPAGTGWSCSCPSRVQPCRHVLALLWLHAEGAVPSGREPPWVQAWLERRTRRTPTAARAPVDAEAQAKRTAQRQARVGAGVDGLEIFLQDLVRDGLGNLADGGYARFEDQARRLVDAQATGLANRVRRLAGVVGRGEGWPAELLGGLGRLALLVEAFHSLETLPVPLQADVRTALGWPQRREHVLAHDDTVADRWQIVGQWEDPGDAQVRTLRTWLVGETSGRLALVLVHAPGERPFADPLPPSGVLEAQLASWPSALPRRALVLTRGDVTPLAASPGGHSSVADWATALAATLGANPFRDVDLVRLTGVRPGTTDDGRPAVIDATGAALPLHTRAPAALLAVSGGAPVDLSGEWDGHGLRPLGVWASGHWTTLGSGR
jgi:hypothetical protein